MLDDVPSILYNFLSFSRMRQSMKGHSVLVWPFFVVVLPVSSFSSQYYISCPIVVTSSDDLAMCIRVYVVLSCTVLIYFSTLTECVNTGHSNRQPTHDELAASFYSGAFWSQLSVLVRTSWRVRIFLISIVPLLPYMLPTVCCVTHSNIQSHLLPVYPSSLCPYSACLASWTLETDNK